MSLIQPEVPQVSMTTRSTLCFLKKMERYLRSVGAECNVCFRVFVSKKKHIELNLPSREREFSGSLGPLGLGSEV